MIEKLTLENYKQFAGVNEIEFSTTPEQNVTLIRGSNGVGKTNFLKAIRWCLRGRKSMRSPSPQERSALMTWQLDNSSPEKTRNVGVVLKIGHGKKKYEIHRQVQYNRASTAVPDVPGKENLTVHQLHKEGSRALSNARSRSRIMADLAVLPDYFNIWFNDWQIDLRSKSILRAAILQLIPEHNYRNKLPTVARESTRLFRRIVGEQSQYHSSTVKIGPTCELKLVKSGLNLVRSLAFEEFVALSFALSLALVKVSGKRFPIILDCPFARISKYKDSIARLLADLDQQVIVLAHDVELYGTKALSPKIGKEYIIQMDVKRGSSRIMPKELMTHAESNEYSRSPYAKRKGHALRK